mgnify:FL=1
MQKPNILIVDDVPINRELLSYILRDQYQIFEAENGERAIEMIESQKQLFHLVLLDIQMPVIDGFGVLEKMREKKLLRHLPVIIISGESSDTAILHAYKLGAVDFFTKPFSPEIVLNRVHNILSLYEHEYKDNLTGGYNRSGFIRMAKNFLRNAPKKSDYALMFLDIKNFKATNELFGTRGGDSVLQDFYGRIEELWTPTLTARLEADHFVCLLPKTHIHMDTMLRDLTMNAQLDDRSMKLYGCCGIYYLEDDEVSVISMIDRAKLAEESVLPDHLQPYAVFDESMRRMYVDQMELMGEYEAAIANGEFQVYYQPVVEAVSGNLISAEALVRWIHPKRGMVSPAAFIPALENGGHISKLDWFVANRVADFSQERYASGEPVIPVSVNLSWTDFYDENVIRGLIDLLGSGKVKKGDIRLEITETSYTALENDREGILEQFRSLGSLILLDDFGSGFSSFGMLKRYSFDILKLDMSFTRQIETSDKVCTIIKGIIEMVHNLGIKVIAEGAETESQVRFLQENHCDYIQGYYFSKPLPEREFVAYIEKCKQEGRLGPAQ